jgi:hypothetical protein
MSESKTESIKNTKNTKTKVNETKIKVKCLVKGLVKGLSPEYEFEKYICSTETVFETVAQYGVAIIPALLNEDECAKMAVGMWNTLEDITQTWDEPINRDNPDSWKHIRKLFPLHSMLIQHWTVGHAQFIWNLRENPKCAAVFAQIWGCNVEDLLVSFDAVSFHMPPETTNIGWHKNTWYHSDQSFTNTGFKCIQSWVTAFDVNEGDGTLAFYESSNQFHSEFGATFGITDKSNWYKINEEAQIQFYADRGCVEKRIKCPAGSMVLWDSRTIHCGVEPEKGRSSPNFRCVAYLCYMPRSLATATELKKKIKAFEEMRMTSHWPCKVKLFGKTPMTYGQPVAEILALERPEIYALGRRLVGYDI